MAFLSAVQLFFVLGYSFALVSPNTNISTNDSGQDIGILVIGGYFFSSSGSATPSVEFLFPSNPEEGSCELDDYPREVYNGPTVHLVSGQLVACYEESCEIHNGGGEWNHLVATRSGRRYHSSAVNENRLLLIG